MINDDPPMWGKRDMTFGHVFFAGSGVNSRHNEMVVALCPNIKMCRLTGLGKAFWETPVATIREENFDVLRSIQDSGKPYPRLEMAGQHPKASGPDAGKVIGDKDYLQNEYPFVEYVNYGLCWGCVGLELWIFLCDLYCCLVQLLLVH